MCTHLQELCTHTHTHTYAHSHIHTHTLKCTNTNVCALCNGWHQLTTCTLQVMLAASYWSLLAPAIEMAEQSAIYGCFVFLPISLGFAAGALFVYLADVLLPILVVIVMNEWHLVWLSIVSRAFVPWKGMKHGIASISNEPSAVHTFMRERIYSSLMTRRSTCMYLWRA